MEELRLTLQWYDAFRIYDQDETGFFYQLLTKFNLSCPEEDPKTVRGSKNMRAKNKTTIAVRTNATGSHVLLPFAIRITKRPVCWGLSTVSEITKLNKTYRSQRSAWIDVKFFIDYLRLWHIEVIKITSDYVCLIFDNFSAYGDEFTDFSGVLYMLILLNVCALYQLLDMDILLALKNKAVRKRY